MGSSRRWKRAKRLVRGGIGELKMSEVLLDFAEPLLSEFQLPRDRQAFLSAVQTAVLLWNAMIDPPAEGHRATTYATLAKAIGREIPPEVEDQFDRMIARGRAKFAHVRLMIVDADVDIEDDGRITVRVLSTPWQGTDSRDSAKGAGMIPRAPGHGG
jgi:hypothetical protein